MKSKKTNFHKIILLIIIIIICVFIAPLQAQDTAIIIDPYELTLQQLGQIQVYTASRELTSIEAAPSVVTVITAEDIRRQGFKRLSEILARVPGFFNSPTATLALIANRGYTQNPNNNYLMLIDGHPVNDVASVGIGNNHLLPFLSQVKRIEIIRGPGSTLWGGDAAVGIIHIFTYDGKDLAKNGELFTQGSIDYEFNQPRYIANAMIGTSLGEDFDLMISFTQTENQAEFQNIRKATSTGLELRDNIVYKADAWRPSHELQLKANLYDFRINARSSRYNGYYSPKREQRSADTRDYKFDFIELSYSPQLSDNLLLETDIYRNWVSLENIQHNDDGILSATKYNSYSENGLNAILSYNGLTNNRMKAGLQLKQRDFNGKFNTNVINGKVKQVAPTGIETATGIFIEDEYSGLEDWRFTLGIRYEKNNFRQAGSDFLPRAAVIWNLHKRWTVKYLYNSGVVRASLTRTRGSDEHPLIFVFDGVLRSEHGPVDPQLAFTHDLQLLFSSDKVRVNLTLFKQDIKNYIAKLPGFDTGQTLPDNTPIFVRETNLGNLEAFGLELEGEYQINKHWHLYGNYSWAVNEIESTSGAVLGLSHATFDLPTMSTYFTNSGRMTGVPEHIWNLGVNWLFSEQYNLNIHYRGWTGNWGKVSTAPEFVSYGPEHYVDINLLFADCFSQLIDIQFYAKNVFDNRSELPSAAHGGNINGFGREIGVSVIFSLSINR